MYIYELFISDDIITHNLWEALFDRLKKYERNVTLEINFKANNVEFYLHTQKDLSAIATLLDKVVLKPILGINETSYLSGDIKNINFQIPIGKNILEINEKEEIKKGRTISKICITPKQFLSFKFFKITVFLQNQLQENFKSSYINFRNPFESLEFNFSNNIKLKKKSVPLFLKFDDATQLFNNSSQNAFLEVFGFPYFLHPVYLPLPNFDFARHSLVVGQTGVGKSKFIELFVKNVSKLPNADEYTIVVIDPHAALFPQLAQIQNNKQDFNFINNSCDLFPGFSDPKISTELTILLFKTLLKEQFNAKMERALKYCIFTLFLSKKMSLTNLRRFLTELNFRKEIISSISPQQEYLNQFFDTEFIEFQTKFYETSIMPILVLIDELNFIPAFSSSMVQENLENSMKNNFLVSFSLSRIFLGEKATRLIAGLIIQQVFLLAQKGTLNKKIILLIDEVSTVENESLISILAEARKFNLSLFLAQQYLTQITPELLKGILSNTSNFFVFKMSDEDAKIIGKNLDISFPDEILIRQKEKGFSEEELKRNLLVTLNPRECLARIFANNKFYPSFKAKTMEV